MHRQLSQNDPRPGRRVARRRWARRTPRVATNVRVEITRGQTVSAVIVDESSTGGACLLLEDNIDLRLGKVLMVWYRHVPTKAEVRHVEQESGKCRVGIRWRPR